MKIKEANPGNKVLPSVINGTTQYGIATSDSLILELILKVKKGQMEKKAQDLVCYFAMN